MRKRLSISLIFSILGHIVLIVLLLVNFSFHKIEVMPDQSVSQINAVAVDSSQVKQQIKRRENQAKQKRQAEYKRKRDAERKRKREEQARKQRIADKKAAEKRKQDERKAAEQQRQKASEEAARKKREADEAERLRVAEEQQRQEEVTRQLEEQLLAEQLEAEQTAVAARRETVMTEVGYYTARIKAKIQSAWNEPERDGICIFRLRLAPGGLVLDFEQIEDVGRYCDSARRAVLKAEPLPMSSELDVIDELRLLGFQLGKNK